MVPGYSVQIADSTYPSYTVTTGTLTASFFGDHTTFNTIGEDKPVSTSCQRHHMNRHQRRKAARLGRRCLCCP